MSQSQPSPPKTEILIDDREDKDNRLQKAAVLAAFPHAQVKRLDVADYVIGGVVGIEFKSLGDAEQDAGKDLWTKIDNLEAYPYRFLVVMGTYNQWRDSRPQLKYNRALWEATKARYEGAEMAVWFARKVSLIRVADPQEFVQFIKRVIKRLEREPKEFQRPVETRKPASRTPEAESEDVLVALKGVGRKAAQSLLTQFGSVLNVANASVEALEATDGIGSKTAQHIHDIFRVKHEK